MHHWSAHRILDTLDKCCDSSRFPMLDNGYVYLAASRMSLYRSAADWGLVIEVFGFSPRSGLPDTHVSTFSSNVYARKSPAQFVNEKAFEAYLSDNPRNESSFVWPIQEGDWMDAEDSELVAAGERTITVRERVRSIPTLEAYARAGITCSRAPRITVFELCRLLAIAEREHVLATPSERTAHLRPELQQILQLEEWNHPDISAPANRPSTSETFRQLAQVLVSGDAHLYKPKLPANTHWKNWPDGGTL